MSTRKPQTKLHSGMTGNGGARGARKGTGTNRDMPYRVAGTTASAYSTRVAGNTNRIWRDER